MKYFLILLFLCLLALAFSSRCSELCVNRCAVIYFDGCMKECRRTGRIECVESDDD